MSKPDIETLIAKRIREGAKVRIERFLSLAQTGPRRRIPAFPCRGCRAPYRPQITFNEGTGLS